METNEANTWELILKKLAILSGRVKVKRAGPQNFGAEVGEEKRKKSHAKEAGEPLQLAKRP